MKKTFTIINYSPAWKGLYLAEEQELIAVFGDLLNSIHHIGSTAIPKAKSKPEIDILIVLKDVSNLSTYDESIEGLGYRVRGECLDSGGTRGRYYYSKDVNNVRTHKLHICQIGHEEIMDKLLFVHLLNKDEETAARYSALKVRLSQSYNYGNHIEKYLKGKDEFVMKALEEAYVRYGDLSYEDFC